jgi:putative transposase
MRATHTELYVHLVWATWDRMPLIAQEIEARLYAAMATKCRELGCEPLAIGGTPDHVHLLVRLDPIVAVASLVKEIKGSSSHFITHVACPNEFFKWQGAYAAFTIRSSEVEQVGRYIQNQKSHHEIGNLDQAVESIS